MDPTQASPVTLDYTLKDLYSLEDGQDPNIVLAFALPPPRVSVASSLIPSEKFIYQRPLEYLTKDELAKQLLHNIPLRYGFVSGDMPLVFFELDPNEHEDNRRRKDLPNMLRPHHTDVMEILGQLNPAQQPTVSFVRSPADLVLQQNSRIAILSPMDCLAHLPHVVDPEIHYSLLSKRGLALSGLPTPESIIIDSQISPDETQCEHSVEQEVQRIIQAICERSLPFLVKVPQSISSHGTFFIRTEIERKKAVGILQKEVRLMIRELGPHNQHLDPCCLITQEFVLGESVAISLFVTQRGRGIFIGCCEQNFGYDGFWTGSSISYPAQQQLKEKYTETFNKVVNYLYSKGYCGPAGIDVMNYPDGRQVVIDLNIRVTGSYQLGCLQGHFTRRGYTEGVLLCLSKLKCTRDYFQGRFENEIQGGSMIITSWSHYFPEMYSDAAITIAAPSKNELSKFVSRIKAFSLI